jgi:putative transposase
MFNDLTDSEWMLVRDLFEKGSGSGERRGRPPIEARVVVNAVLWIVASREGWSKLPGRFPSQPTCRRRFEKWETDGTLAELVRRLRASGREIKQRDKARSAVRKPTVLAFYDRSRGAFWTNPASWSPSQTEQSR